jgi:hypothetical protein
MKVLYKIWWGQYSLPVQFWLFYIVGSVAAIFVSVVAAAPLLLLDARPAAYLVGAVVAWGYWFVASVGVWRSADAYPLTRWWPNLAKGVVVLFTLVFLYRLLTGGAEHFLQATL